MTILYDDWLAFTIVSGQFPGMTQQEMEAYDSLAEISIPGLSDIAEKCRVQAGVLAIAHLAELMGDGCGVPLTGVQLVQNDTDRVVFTKRSDSELEATKWGFQLRQLLRVCQPCLTLYYGDQFPVGRYYGFAPSY
jgi:hypothetical protein